MTWPMVELGSLVSIKTGKLDANAASESGIYPFFTCSKTTLKINDYEFDDDAILVAGNGDLNVKHYSGKFNAYQRTYVVIAKDSSLHTRFLYYFMDKYVDKLREQSIGGVIKYIKLGMLTEAKTPLPPLAEQQRIAAILDKADAIRRKRQQAIQLADEFLRAVFLDMFGDPVTNPKGWGVVMLDDVLEAIESGSSPKCETRVAHDKEWGVLKLGAVTTGAFIASENKAIFSDYEPNLKYEVKPGDLLFTRKNTFNLVAAVALVEETRKGLLLPDLIFRLCIKTCVEKYFLWKLLSNTSMRSKIQALASGAAGSMPNISKANLKTVEIILPPMEEQMRFGEICKKVSLLKNDNEGFLGSQEDLFSSLSQKAFKGEL
ncbi:MAG: restriction endonuclease subunit S [Oceanospirillaceae bacterium]|nr:restriction endonuclease subunit S [Oceanospirillaceae bacterium]